MINVKSLQALLNQMDWIEGTTEGGREFKILYLDNQGFRTQIFDGNGAVYEPVLRMSEVAKNNILSTINKIDEVFFTAIGGGYKSPIRTERKTILIRGSQGGKDFSIACRVENNWISARLHFRGSNHDMNISREVPDHIHVNQKHDWLYLHHQKPESWLDALKFNIREHYYKCCGTNMMGKMYYCFNCGKSQTVENIEINLVEPKELLILLS